MRKRLTIEDYQTVAIDRNIVWVGKILPKNNHTKTLWKCKICLHGWTVSYHSVQQKRGCPECRRLNKFGKGNPFYKKQHTQETKQLMSDNHADFSGEKHPGWKPELTEEERLDRHLILGYIEWRNEVYERDNYTCQVCGKRGGNLEAHHKNSYRANPDQRTLLSNGVCLCKTCHKNFHHQYGYGDNTEKQFEEFKCQKQ